MRVRVPDFAYKRAATACLAVLLLCVGTGVASAKRGSSFDASEVRREIRRDLPKINRCYESALRHDPSLAGKVAVQFTVAPEGDVHEAEVVHNTTGSPQVARCVARVVSKVRFRPRRAGEDPLRFTFPFVFALQ